VIENAQEQFDKALPQSVWQKPPEKIALLPILPSGETGHEGVLVVGLNPYRLFDQDYGSFLKLVATQIASAVTNARAYEEERRRAEALAEIDRAKTHFFSNISHEFRTPLTLMLGILDQTLKKNSLDASDKKELEVVYRNGLRLLKLVNSLLDFTRVEAGRMKAVFNPTDLGVFTAYLASNFHSACEQAGVILEIDTTNANEQVYVDTDMWEKIIFNLLSNAFKFTFEGKITVTLETRNDQAILIVSDTGTGIPEEELPNIFDRFHRIENARGRTHEGTGIGLALVQELVKLHGGIAEVNSVFGQGSTFTIKLPLGLAHLPSAQIGNKPTQYSSGIREEYYVKEACGWLPEKKHDLKIDPETSEQTQDYQEGRKVILLADDNVDMREYAQKILSSKYNVLIAPDGQTALELARSKNPDLVLSDIMMPKLDGFGLLKALREDQDLCHLPSILLSARAGEEAEIEGLEARADDYLVKPFSSRELLARLDSIFAIKELRKAQEENFRIIADNSPAILWTTDPDGSCTYLNNQWYETTGGNPGEDLHFGWLEKVHPEDIEKTKTIFLDANKKQIPFRLDYRLKGKNGGYSWATDAGMPRFDKTGRFLGFVGCVFDISESKRMEAVLYGQKQALELAMNGASLDAILGIFTRAVESQSEENVIASILLLDETGKHLMYGADLS
jgi:PAS domain S-box-containing protein